MHKKCYKRELSLINIPNIRVGHVTHQDNATGCTVVICDQGACCGVDIRGNAPGTRDTALLAPHCTVEKVNAILLTGGSAFGLAAADGVMRYCQEQGYGFGMGTQKIPIVPAAVIYDFNIGKQSNAAPTAEDGYQACLNATDTENATGNVGAGTGAIVGKICGFSHAMRGGLGTAHRHFSNGLRVSAMVVVNTFGDVRHYADNRIIAGARSQDGGFIDAIKYIITEKQITPDCHSNTLIGVVASNAQLDKVALTQIAKMANIGVAQVITPAHTQYDGDTFFALATGDIKADATLVGIASTELVKQAILNAMLSAVGRDGFPATSELHFRTCS